MTQVMQYVDEIPDAPYELRVYCGADAEFLLYEDAGDSYDYESGNYALIQITWSESKHELTLATRKGSFPQLIQERDYTILFISENGTNQQTVRYTGEKLIIKRPPNHTSATPSHRGK